MSAATNTRKLPHRGALNNIPQFAPDFLRARLKGFEKDMRICLTGIQSDEQQGLTHAYFPALMACCGMLEYLAGLHIGRVNKGLNYKDIISYAKYLPQPDYDPEAIRVLFETFRNAVAHRGIASGVWVDPHPGMNDRRLTWRVMADTARPALEVVESKGELIYDSPWPCKYTHRVHIHLGRLWRDIRDSVDDYLYELGETKNLQDNFAKCMRILYPT